jgi:site-specific DNA-methyltransferase (adenine-specific)
VKPIDLARYLATLLLPPAEYTPRRILIPFSGSGSEMIGAWLAGWEDIQGVEQSEEYAEIARARLDWWLKQGRQLSLFDAAGGG